MAVVPSNWRQVYAAVIGRLREGLAFAIRSRSRYGWENRLDGTTREALTCRATTREGIMNGMNGPEDEVLTDENIHELDLP